MPRPLGPVAAQDRERTAGDQDDHDDLGWSFRSQQPEGGQGRGPDLVRKARAVGRQGGIGDDPGRQGGIGLPQRARRRDLSAQALVDGSLPDGDVPGQVVDLQPERLLPGQLPRRSQEIDRRRHLAGQPGVFGRRQQPARSQLPAVGEPGCCCVRGGRGRIRGATTGSAPGFGQRIRRPRVPPQRRGGQVPGPAVGMLGGAQDLGQRAVGLATVGRGGRVVDGRPGQRMHEIEAAVALGDQARGGLRRFHVLLAQPQDRTRRRKDLHFGRARRGHQQQRPPRALGQVDRPAQVRAFDRGRDRQWAVGLDHAQIGRLGRELDDRQRVAGGGVQDGTGNGRRDGTRGPLQQGGGGRAVET